MKHLLNIAVSIFLIFTGIYLSVYLFVPFYLNKNDYSYLITEAVKKQSNLDLVIKNYKVSVSPSLNITLSAKHVMLFYPDRKQILDVRNADIDFSTFALFKKQLKLQSLKATDLQFSNKILKNGKFSLQEYLEKNIKKDSVSDFVICEDIPAVKIKNILVKIKDEKTGQKFKLETTNLKIEKHLIGKDYLLSASGNVFYFNQKYFGYKLKLIFPSDVIKNVEIKPIVLSFDNLQKYKFRADINADLRLSSGKKNDLSGFLNVDNFTMLAEGKRLPPSYFHFLFKKNKAVADAVFFAAKGETAQINAKFDNSNNIYLRFNSKKLGLKNVKPVIISLFDILRIKNNLSDFDVNGYIVSDFEVETDLKKVKSHGHLKVYDAQLKHKEIPLKISGINADVDFSGNNINIKNSKLLVNSQPVSLSGTVNDKAQGDIILKADGLTVSHIMNAFPFLKLSDDIIVDSGNLSFYAVLRGNLKTVSPKIDLKITSFSAGYKQNKTKLAFSKAYLEIKNATKDKFDGTIKVFGLNIKDKTLPSSLISENITGVFNEKDFNLNPSKFKYDKALLTVEGGVKNYLKTPSGEFKAFGTVDTSLLKTFASTAVPNLKLYSKGVLPVGIRALVNGKNISLESNILASQSAYITPVILKSINTALFRFDARVSENQIIIKDCSLYYPPSKIQLSDKIDTSKLKKIATVSGTLKDRQAPSAENIRLYIPSPLTLSVEPLSSVKVSTDLVINGMLKSPQIQGHISLFDVFAPAFYAKKIDLKNDKKLIYINAESVKIYDTLLSFDAVAENDFYKSKKINNLNLQAKHLDTDDLLKLSALLPQAKYSPGNEAPFDVLSGKLNLNSVKLNKVKAENITSDFRIQKNIMYLDNLRGNAYGGSIAADITYNFLYLHTNALIQARGLNSGSAASDILPVDPKISGRLNFDSNITMSGITDTQQMKTLKGKTDVLITSAQLGPLGRFEHFLHAQNLLSQRFIYASLNSAKRAIAPKNTGYVNQLKGSLKFNNGIAYLSPLTTSGPQMSMYITGAVNMLTNTVDLQILGKVSPDVSDSVGVLGDVTLKNIIDEHTKYGETITKLFTSYNTELPEMDISKIPPLSAKYSSETKNFRVLVDGDPESIKAIKSFTWINPAGTRLKLKNKQPVGEDTAKPVEKNVDQSQKEMSSPPPIQINTNTVQIEPPKTPANNFLDSIPDDFK